MSLVELLSPMGAAWATALALLAALLAVTRTSPVHGLGFLVTALLGLACAFFALGAPFAGALQILVYVGAVVVVFVFVVMTLEASAPGGPRERFAWLRAGVGPAILAALILAPFVLGLGVEHIAPGPDAGISAQSVGRVLFGSWALAVELASFLLLAGLLGVRHLGRRDRPDGARGS